MCKAIMIINDGSQLFVKYQFALGLHVYDITYNSVYSSCSGAKLCIFTAVASWAPKNNNFSCSAKFLGVQQLTLHICKIQNLSSQLGYCLKIFRGSDKILMVSAYWVPVKIYPWIWFTIAVNILFSIQVVFR